MAEVEISETEFGTLLDLVRRGEEVTLLDHGLTVAKVIPVVEREQGPRQLGRLEGRFRVPDDVDAPLPDDLLDLFEGDPSAVERDRLHLFRGTGGT